MKTSHYNKDFASSVSTTYPKPHPESVWHLTITTILNILYCQCQPPTTQSPTPTVFVCTSYYDNRTIRWMRQAFQNAFFKVVNTRCLLAKDVDVFLLCGLIPLNAILNYSYVRQPINVTTANVCFIKYRCQARYTPIMLITYMSSASSLYIAW